MKVFISVDMEGIGGITSRREMREGKEVHDLMTGEVNAAVAGIKASGEPVEEICVCDSHSYGENLLLEKLDPAVRIVKGFPRPHYMVQGIEAGYDLLFLLGYHGRAGTLASQMDHTMAGFSIYNIRLNGRPLGEMELSAGLAGHYGVPLGLAAGDDTFCAQVAEVLPGVPTVTTKWGISRYAAKHRHPQEIRAELQGKAAQAVRDRAGFRPLRFEPPLRVEVDFLNSVQADMAALVPVVERLSGRTLAFTAPDFLYLYRMIMTVTSLAEVTRDW